MQVLVKQRVKILMNKRKLKLLLVSSFLTASLRSAQPSSATTDESSSVQPSSDRSPGISEKKAVQTHNEALGLALAPDTPEICLAAFKGDIVTLRRLISSGVNVESAGRERRTPLLVACSSGHIEAASALLAAGAQVNARDVTGATALHEATQQRDRCMVFLLLSHRPEVNVKDEFGVTPLMWAAINGDKPTVVALLAAGAERDLTDADGLTAADWAKKNHFTEIAALLTPPPKK
jgi:ankyrin repeat protein